MSASDWDAKGAADPAPFVDAFREAYEASDRNPLYALSAFTLCPAETPLPAWIRDAVGEMAMAVLRLERDHWNSKITATQAAKALPAAMGFVRDGWNAFKDAAASNEGAWVALDAHYFEARMGCRESAISHLMAERNEARSTVFEKIKKAKDRGLSKD